jgi:hypothetical protein
LFALNSRPIENIFVENIFVEDIFVEDNNKKPN